MFLRTGKIERRLFPGEGGTYSEVIGVPPTTTSVHVVMNGFSIEYSGGDNHIEKMVVNLTVKPTEEENKYLLTCDFNLNDQNTSGDTFWAACDYVLIGK